MKVFSDEGSCFIDMEHSLTINDVEAFKKELTPALTTDKEFLVHCIDLKEIDSAGIQVLVSLKKHLSLDEKKIFEISAGNKFKEMISLVALDKYFESDII